MPEVALSRDDLSSAILRFNAKYACFLLTTLCSSTSPRAHSIALHTGSGHKDFALGQAQARTWSSRTIGLYHMIINALNSDVSSRSVSNLLHEISILISIGQVLKPMTPLSNDLYHDYKCTRNSCSSHQMFIASCDIEMAML